MPPIEVFTVPTHNRDTSDGGVRICSADEFASNIKKTYEHVAAVGGTVLSHTMVGLNMELGRGADSPHAVIVADIPPAREPGELLDDEVGARPSLHSQIPGRVK